MCNKIMLGVVFFGFVSGLHAADKKLLEQEKLKRLSKSTPAKKNSGKRIRAESHASVLKQPDDTMLHRKSAPTRLSREKWPVKDDNATDHSNNDREQVALEEEKAIQRVSTNSSPQRSRFTSRAPSSKKLFFVSSDMLDDTLVLGINHARSEVKKIAQDNALKASNFYTIIKGMRAENVLSNVQVIMLANYFLYKIAPMQSCRNYLNASPSYIPVPSSDFTFCVQAIRTCLDMVTHCAIVWPSVSREENNNRYYKELLEYNTTIHVADVASSYYGAAVAIGLLAQIKDRSLNMKERFREATESEKLIKRHCKALAKQFETMACFVSSLNIEFDAEPLKDEAPQ
jgi:hypothetical protein